MRLSRLSTASIVGCSIGLLALVTFGAVAHERMRDKQEQMARLLTLQKRLDDFSAGSDSLLLFHADERLQRAFREDAAALQRELRSIGEGYPAAETAAREIGLMIAALEEARTSAPGGSGAPSGADAGGPLDIPERARIIMNEVASHGVALDTALDRLLRERQQRIAIEATWIAGSFAGAALLFAVLSLIAFGLIHRRIGGPIQQLAATIDRIRAGESRLRADSAGTSELSRLASAFNQLLDERAASDARIARQQETLREHERMLDHSQLIAKVGSWRLDIRTNRLEWSDETFRIVGLPVADAAPSPEAYFRFVHADDRAHLLELRERALTEGIPHDVEFRLVHSDGSIRRVHELAEVERDEQGEAIALAGSIQDITERYRFEQRLRQFHHLIESGSDLYCVIDADHRYVFANDDYAALYGLSGEEIEGRHLLDVLTPTFYKDEAAPRIDLCLGGESISFEGERDYPHLGTRRFLIRYFPVTATEGNQRNVGAVMTDITEFRQAEERLREQARMLDIAGRIARFGGWWIDLEREQVHWSDIVAEIHGMPHGYSPTVEEGIGFFAPEYRETIRTLFSACAEKGIPYDEELKILDGQGERVWARVVAEPVYNATGDISQIHGAFQDISARKEADLKLERLNARLANVLESISDAFYTLTPEWCFDYINSAAGELLQCDPATLIGRNVWTEFPGAVGTRIERNFHRAVRDRVTVGLEEYYEPLETWFDIRAYPINDGLAVYFRDVTERHEMEEQLRNREEELRISRDELAATLDTRQLLINALPAHIALLDVEGTVIDVNDQWRHYGLDNASTDACLGVGRNYLSICDSATGECADEAQATADGLRAVLDGARDNFSIEYPCHSPDKPRWFRMMANRLGDNADAGAVVMHVDITERKLAEQELNRLAYEDPLTGLPSRNGFVQTLTDRLWQTGWQPNAMVIMFDIRRHRDINDSYGYTIGDRLLQAIGERMGEAVGEEGVLGRVGGDEFVIFLPDRDGAAAPRERDRIAQAFETPFAIDDLRIEAVARFGYTLLGDEPRATEETLREAELALFDLTASKDGTDWRAYSTAIDHEVHQHVEITGQLREALAGDQFQLYFQPKVRLKNGEVVASEALLRWAHPEFGLRSPAMFIPIAEQSQLIGPIGDWALDEACRCLRAWHDAGLSIVRVAVNVSLVQFMIGDYPETVARALARHEVDPGALTLEITESVFERESEALNQQLRHLHDMGVRLSLDDFGTGYSSLLYLQRYPFDEIKIDQGFVRHMLTDPYSHQIVNTVIGVAGALNAEVVAEGVETAAERDALLEMGCRIGQGFYYSMPLEVEDFRWLLEQQSNLPLSRASGTHE